MSNEKSASRQALWGSCLDLLRKAGEDDSLKPQHVRPGQAQLEVCRLGILQHKLEFPYNTKVRKQVQQTQVMAVRPSHDYFRYS